MSSPVCLSCVDEMCFICENPKPTLDGGQEACCCQGTFGKLTLFGPHPDPSESGQLTRSPGRPKLSGAEMKNAVQAGRARAEDIAPITEGMMCEWAMLRFAGGGIEPIVGCEGNEATERHHGPNKSTLDNDPGINLHRICSKCHNRWHYRNDEYYGPRPDDNSAYFPSPEHGLAAPHDRVTQASGADVVSSNGWWALPVAGRKPYRSWESKNERADATT